MKLRRFALRWAFVAVCLVLWESASRFGWVQPSHLPSPIGVLRAGWDMLRSGTLPIDCLTSAGRVVGGYVLGALAGVFLGCTLALFARLAITVTTPIELLRPIPPIAWIPLAILWFGIGTPSALFLVALAAFFPIFSNSLHGMASVPDAQLNAARCLGASRTLILTDVLLPAALPQIITGLRIGLGTAWTSVIAAEMIGAQSGLGYSIQLNRILLQTENVVAAMVAIGIIGALLNRAFSAMAGSLAPWARTTLSDELSGREAA